MNARLPPRPPPPSPPLPPPPAAAAALARPAQPCRLARRRPPSPSRLPTPTHPSVIIFLQKVSRSYSELHLLSAKKKIKQKNTNKKAKTPNVLLVSLLETYWL